MTWETGGLAVFSVFGSCLMCTLGGDYGVTTEGARKEAAIFHSLGWGTEGSSFLSEKPVKYQKSKKPALLPNACETVVKSYIMTKHIRKIVCDDLDLSQTPFSKYGPLLYF
jgi:hypothetical protein